MRIKTRDKPQTRSVPLFTARNRRGVPAEKIKKPRGTKGGGADGHGRRTGAMRVVIVHLRRDLHRRAISIG